MRSTLVAAAWLICAMPVWSDLPPGELAIRKAVKTYVLDVGATGAAVAIIEKGKVKYHVVMGFCAADHSKRVDEDTVFFIGSVSKAGDGRLSVC